MNYYYLTEIIDSLNSMSKADPEAIRNLVEFRVPCNLELAEHPACQVGRLDSEIKAEYQVGLLGVLNGIVGTRRDGQGLIVAILESNGNIYFKENKE